MIPSKYQQDIYDFVSSGRGHGIVEAVAGSGKTTTIIKALDLLPSTSKVMFLAFNKHIADELATRIPMGFEARTLHSLGYSIIRKSHKVRVANGMIYKIIKERVPSKLVRSHNQPIQKIISLAKSLLIEPVNEIDDIVDRYGIELPKGWCPEYVNDVWQAMLAIGNNINFDDMVWLPVSESMEFPKYDYVFVDEAQDLAPVQLEFVSRLLHSDSRLLAVGDSHQAIYGFRGAGLDSMDQIRKRFDATELPLSICYRCSKSVVEHAKKLVPHIEAYSESPEGLVSKTSLSIFREALGDGDYVLCRITKDLVKECMHQIRLGKKAMVKGRDVGDTLVALVKNLGGTDIGDFLLSLAEWTDTQLAVTKSEDKRVVIEDKNETLWILAEGCVSTQLLIDRINKIFSDTIEGIVFSTIHKSKGLEADNIFVLREDLLPHPRCALDWQKEQETNLEYVAITRAKESLTWVSK